MSLIKTKEIFFGRASGQDKKNPVIWLVGERAEFYHLARQQIIVNSWQAKPTDDSVKINKKNKNVICYFVLGIVQLLSITDLLFCLTFLVFKDFKVGVTFFFSTSHLQGSHRLLHLRPCYGRKTAPFQASAVLLVTAPEQVHPHHKRRWALTFAILKFTFLAQILLLTGKNYKIQQNWNLVTNLFLVIIETRDTTDECRVV